MISVNLYELINQLGFNLVNRLDTIIFKFILGKDPLEAAVPATLVDE